MSTATSIAAFDSVKPHAARLRTLVYCAIQANPRSCDELEQDMGLSHQCASARCSELKRLGLIVDSGMRTLTRSGRQAIVWTTSTNSQGIAQ